MSVPLPDAAVPACRTRVRAAGQRWTAARARVLAVALAQRGHFDVEDLCRAAGRGRAPRLSRATIYRTLPLLQAAGLLSALPAGRQGTRYEVAHGTRHHDHLRCLACGALLELSDPALERAQERACRRHGFVPQRHTLVIEGLCRTCAGGGRG